MASILLCACLLLQASGTPTDGPGDEGVAGQAPAFDVAASGLSAGPAGREMQIDVISVPRLINYQGKLTDPAGNPRNGEYDMVFKLYTSEIGGVPFWQESHPAVLVENGIFNVALGSYTPITDIPDGPNCYFEITVEGQIASPRIRMVSAPYAYNSDDAANLGGIPAAAHITVYTPAVGDLNGFFPNPLVDGLQGRPVSGAAPSSGQVLKWNGSSWLPQQDLAGSGVTSVGQGTGVVCMPNPITSTGLARLDTIYTDQRYILNQTAVTQTPGGFKIAGAGTARQFYAASVAPNVPALWGEGQANAPGLFSRTALVTSGAAEALHTGLTGTGLIAAGNNVSPVTMASGSGAAFTGSGVGQFSHATAADGTGVIGVGNNAPVNATLTGGSGGAFAGTKAGVYGLGENAGGTGVVGAGNNAATAYMMSSGSGGAFTGDSCGAFGTVTADNGTGVVGTGNNIDTARVLVTGSGGAFTGTTAGVFGFSQALSGDRCGGYFADSTSGAFAWVGASVSGSVRKILGSGTVNTVMGTRQGNRMLYAPEMPEAWCEDVGGGRLADGHCRVDLDPLFTDCVVIGEQPMRVFVQLEDDCRGVYVRKDATGFDVYELQGGTSNARFSWRVMAKWKGYEHERFLAAPAPGRTAPAARTARTVVQHASSARSQVPPRHE